MARHIRTEDAAARVGAALWANRGRTFHIEELAAETGLTVEQVRGAENYLKAFVNDRPEKFRGYALYIALGNESEHGFIKDGETLEDDVVRRLKYCVTRARSELEYREQAAARVKDEKARKLLRRGLEYSRVAKQAFEDAYDRILVTQDGK